MTGIRPTLGVHPIGIDAARFEREMDDTEFRERCCQASTKAYAGKRLVLSVERLDYTKGIVRRLDAIEMFLSTTVPAERDERCISCSSRCPPGPASINIGSSGRPSNIASAGSMVSTRRCIIRRFTFFTSRSRFTELCALYALADVAFVTPLIDGMNLVAKEFIACQRRSAGLPVVGHSGGDRPGVLILSEFAGAAQELPNAVTVNPYDVPGMAAAIEQALSMPADERRQRMWPMRDRVFANDAATWARRLSTPT